MWKVYELKKKLLNLVDSEDNKEVASILIELLVATAEKEQMNRDKSLYMGLK